MFYEEIKIKQGPSYISFCPLRILYNRKFILMATSLGTNAVIVTRDHYIKVYTHAIIDIQRRTATNRIGAAASIKTIAEFKLVLLDRHLVLISNAARYRYDHMVRPHLTRTVQRLTVSEYTNIVTYIYLFRY